MALNISRTRSYPLDELPDYVVQRILRLLTLKDLCKAARVCAKFRLVAFQDEQVRSRLAALPLASARWLQP